MTSKEKVQRMGRVSVSRRAPAVAGWPLTVAATALAVVGWTLVGCGRTGSAIFADGGTGPDAAQDGGTDAETVPDGSGVCPEGSVRCRGTTIEVCVSDSWQVQTNCDFPCAPDPTPHCGDPVFSNGIEPSDFQSAATPLNLLPGLAVIDTDDASITGPGAPPAGSYPVRVIDRGGVLPAIVVLSFSEINIPQGTEVQVVGTRILALVSPGDITVNGILDEGVHPDGSPGPGGYTGGAAGAAGDGAGGGDPGQVGSLSFDEGGGAGAGMGASGGNGGAGAQASGGQGGDPYGNPQLDPIVGGSGGGSGASGTASTPGAGGSGGGALILACLGTVTVGPNGGIDAGGGGGRGGGLMEAGGGGGSGGSILLAAHTVNIYGTVAANGGGGGGSDSMTTENGQDGQLSNQPAAAGGTGGQGGADTTVAGSSGTDAAHHGPGGGGACGRIRIETVGGPVLDGTLSPAETTTAFSMAPIRVE